MINSWQTFSQTLVSFLPGIDLVFWALIALLLDTMLGGRKYLGKIPGPDHIFHSILKVLCPFLDHDKYAFMRRLLRGLLVLSTGIIVLIPIGLWFDSVVRESLLGKTLGVLVLMLIFGQKTVRDHTLDLVTLLNNDAHKNNKGRFVAAQWAIERLTLRLADGMVANGFVLFISGFWGLFAYRFIVMMLAVGSSKGILRPQSPFYIPTWLLYEAITILPALFTFLLTSLAALLYPVTRKNVFKRFFLHTPNSLISRELPLKTIAHVMNFSFLDRSQEDGEGHWFETKKQNKKPSANDLKETLTLITIVWWIELTSLIVALSVLVLLPSIKA